MLHRCTLRLIGIVASLAVSGLESPGILGWTVSTSLSLSLSSSSRSSSRSSPSTTNNRLSSSSFVDGKGIFPRIIRSSGQGMSPSSLSLSLSSGAVLGDSSSLSQFKVLGVCGGIGSGKSTACKLLVDSCNCLAHIDADKVAHSVYAPGSKAVQDVVNEFGTNILLRSGDDDDETNATDTTPMEIDRKKLGAVVFAERSAMAKLEAIVWPHVKDQLVETIRGLKETFDNNKDNESERRPVVVLEAAVLLDAGWDDVVDGVWVVTTPRETALERLVQTRNLTTEEASKRIDAQESRKGIGAIGDEVEQGVVQCVVTNGGSLDELTEILEKSLDDPGCWKKKEL